MPSSLQRTLLVLVAALLPTLAVRAADLPPALLGFAADTGARELALEGRFDALLDAREMRLWLEHLAAEPNHIGSPHDKANAEYMRQLFQGWGWQARIETFDVLYPIPRHVALDLVGPHPYHATLTEPPIPGDRSSAHTRGALPPYNVYGADGDVAGELVYVNYGMPDDYRELARRNVSVKGRVVIARYGGGWRGLKPKLAYEHGAIGCLIYSDPRDDGYGAADPYPAGAGRPAAGLQRGSVADTPLYTGDPLTPGVGSTPGAARLARADAQSLLKIPVLPISARDAQPLLAALAGPRAPTAWRGGLPFTYHVGPGAARVHLVIESDWAQRPVYDVIATLTGSVAPDQWILRGNHHDAWVFGANDPLSGTVAMMGEMKALGALQAAGWRPRRTLVYASWDGEEAGLLGSTEWVETHAAELAAKAVAYVNSDTNKRGFLGAGGSHSLQRLVNEVAAGVQDPASGASVLARAKARAILAARRGGRDADRRTARALLDGADLPIDALGSGSDFTPFLQHAGIASLNLGFGDDEPSGVYHSAYDTLEHYLRIDDPDLRYGVALAEVAGHVVLRLADADLVPMRTQDFAATLGRYVDELEHAADAMREDTLDAHRLLDQHVYELAASATDPVAPPAREAEVPYLNLAPLHNAVAALAASAHAFDAAYAAALADPGGLAAARAVRVDQALRLAEQTLLGTPGLPGRPWYRHLIYAPGLYTGYAAKTLPGVREAIEERHWAQADEYTARTAAALDAYRLALESATAALR